MEKGEWMPTTPIKAAFCNPNRQCCQCMYNEIFPSTRGYIRRTWRKQSATREAVEYLAFANRSAVTWDTKHLGQPDRYSRRTDSTHFLRTTHPWNRCSATWDARSRSMAWSSVCSMETVGRICRVAQAAAPVEQMGFFQTGQICRTGGRAQR